MWLVDGLMRPYLAHLRPPCLRILSTYDMKNTIVLIVSLFCWCSKRSSQIARLKASIFGGRRAKYSTTKAQVIFDGKVLHLSVHSPRNSCQGLCWTWKTRYIGAHNVEMIILDKWKSYVKMLQYRRWINGGICLQRTREPLLWPLFRNVTREASFPFDVLERKKCHQRILLINLAIGP